MTQTPEQSLARDLVDARTAMKPVRDVAARLHALTADIDRACQLGDAGQLIAGAQQVLQEVAGFGRAYRRWLAETRPGRTDPGSDAAGRSST